MTADRKAKRRRRDVITFFGMAYGVLGLIALQLWLRFSGHPTVSAIFGILVLAGVVFVFLVGIPARPVAQLAQGASRPDRPARTKSAQLKRSRTDRSREAYAMRKLTYGMNVSLDGYIAAPGDNLGWSAPSDELFQWWSDRVAATGLALYGRKLWQTMSSHWPTADQQPGIAGAHIEFADRWRNMLKVVFSSTISEVDWNARLVAGDAVMEIIRLKHEDGGPMDIGGATLAAAALRAGLIDEYVIVKHPVLVGGGTPFFPSLDNWVNLNLVETRTFPDGVLLTRYETRR